MKIKIVNVFFVILALSSALVLGNPNIEQDSFTSYLIAERLFTEFGVEIIDTPLSEPVKESKDFWVNAQKQLDPEIKNLTSREIQQIAFNLVVHHNSYFTDIVDRELLSKLNILAGNEDLEKNLFDEIFNKYLHTTLGKAHTALTLCHPTTNSQLIGKRQKAIIELSNDLSGLKNMDACFRIIKNIENKSLLPWSSTTLVNQNLLNQQYFCKWLNPGGIINTNTLMLEFFSDTYLMFPPLYGRYAGSLLMTAIPASLIVGIAFLGKLIKQKGNYSSYWAMGQKIPKITLDFFKDNETSLQEKLSCLIGPPFLLYQVMKVTYHFYLKLKNNAELYKHLQDGLIASTQHIRQLKKISSYINSNRNLLKYLPSLQPLADFNYPHKRSSKLNKLMGMLNTNTFKGQPSFWSIIGRVLAAYQLMRDVKEELAPVFAAAGELEMYTALAQLYNSSKKNHDAHFCMVDFIENSATPVIDTQNFWNPFINPDKVVPNSITFDTSCPNSILTGPNTGGKSTIIKALMLNTLLAQTFGIAAADSFALTPFAKLNCFMNISDDIATGASLFKSEVMRAKKLLDSVQSLQEDEFSFVITDEVFTGTSPKEGEQAACAFAKKLGSYKNNIAIIATHYPKMTELEEETNGAFYNHHIEILQNEDGSLNRTFKLKTGPSFFNVASNILEEEGLFI